MTAVLPLLLVTLAQVCTQARGDFLNCLPAAWLPKGSDYNPPPDCEPYDGSRLPDCSQFSGDVNTTSFYHVHEYDCGLFWECLPENDICLMACPKCILDPNSCPDGRLQFDCRYPYPIGPVCDWPDNVQCINCKIPCEEANCPDDETCDVSTNCQCSDCRHDADCPKLEVCCERECADTCGGTTMTPYPHTTTKVPPTTAPPTTTPPTTNPPPTTTYQPPTTTCPTECCADEECPDGYFCDNGDCKCKTECCTDAECPDGYSCENGECDCLTECCEDAECPDGYICEDGECKCATECCSDAECPDGYICEDGECKCATECCSDAECPEGETCEDGSCVAPTTTPQPTTTTTPHPTTSTTPHSTTSCPYECCDDLDCPDGFKCEDGTCKEACTKDEECEGWDAICNHPAYDNCNWCDGVVCQPGCATDANCPSYRPLCTGIHGCGAGFPGLVKVDVTTYDCTGCPDGQLQKEEGGLVISPHDPAGLSCTSKGLDNLDKIDYTNGNIAEFSADEEDGLDKCKYANLNFHVTGGNVTWTGTGTWTGYNHNAICFYFFDDVEEYYKIYNCCDLVKNGLAQGDSTELTNCRLCVLGTEC